LLGERPTPVRLARMLLALTGVVIVLRTGDAPWPVPQGLADWLAIAGGLSFALTNILLRKLHHVETPSRILAMFGGGAAFAALAGVIGTTQGIVTLPHDASWWPLALGLGVAFLASNMGLQYGAA